MDNRTDDLMDGGILIIFSLIVYWWMTKDRQYNQEEKG